MHVDGMHLSGTLLILYGSDENHKQPAQTNVSYIQAYHQDHHKNKYIASSTSCATPHWKAQQAVSRLEYCSWSLLTTTWVWGREREHEFVSADSSNKNRTKLLFTKNTNANSQNWSTEVYCWIYLVVVRSFHIILEAVHSAWACSFVVWLILVPCRWKKPRDSCANKN